MRSSTAPDFSPTSIACTAFAGFTGSARAVLAARSAAQAARWNWVFIVLLLEGERSFLGQADHRLRLVARAVGPDRPLRDDDLAAADRADDAAVLPDAGAAAQAVADAVRRLDHRDRIFQAGHHRDEPQLLHVEAAERRRAAARDAVGRRVELAQVAAEGVALAG